MATFSTQRQNHYPDNNNDLHEQVLIARKDGTVVQEDNYLYVGEYTSKNRLKVSNFETVFFNTFQYGKETDVWDEVVVGDAAAVHNINTNNVDMRVAGTSGVSIYRQTRNVQRYIPGRQSQLTFAVRLETPVTGIRRRFGLFDEDNGFYFEDSGVIVGDIPQYNVVIRSKASGSIVENRVARADWNGDKLDGTGKSGIIADSTKQQLISFEYEWYGAGQVRVLWNIDGTSHLIHTFGQANIQELPWCSTPFLPIRMELECISTVGGNHYLYQGSNSLVSEGQGGLGHKIGIAENVSSPITGTTTTIANSWYPILSIRLKPADLKGVVLPAFFQTATADNTNLFYRVCRNPVIPTAVVAGQDGPQPWLDMQDANAFTQYQTYIDPAAIADSDQGISVDSGFITGAGGERIAVDPNTQYQLGRTSMGTVSDTYTILCATTGANKKALASMTWIEQR
jgi:hypothetical protein